MPALKSHRVSFMLEKKQVISFLKILQIPADQSREEIELALKKAGWNSRDAAAAAAVLHPADTKQQPEGVPPAPPQQDIVPPQTVAQVTLSDEGAEIVADTAGGKIAEVTPIFEEESEHARSSSQFTPKSVSVPAVSNQSVVTNELQGDAQPVEEHLVAKPLTEGQMSDRFLRSDAPLSPESISRLLGVDVEIPSEDVQLKKAHQRQLSLMQVVIIVSFSVILAGSSFMYGMYYFKVGFFHESHAQIIK